VQTLLTATERGSRDKV